MKAVVAGATGLIGSFLIEKLSADSAFTEVIALTRNESESTGKVKWLKLDFTAKSQLEAATHGAEVVFCCLGTTMKKAGSKGAFLEVDFRYVAALSEAAKKNDVRQFSVISAMGAAANSRIFYNRVKGQMEEAVTRLDFIELIILRPSILLGPRRENRPGERIGIALAKFFTPLLVGPLKKYRPIAAEDVALAMCREAKRLEKRRKVLTYKEILG